MLRDASDYIGARPGGPDLPADRQAELAPRQFWQAPTPVEQAMSAALAPKAETVEVYVSDGRWVVSCPDCGGAQLAAREDPRFMCNECANLVIGGRWRRVKWPTDAVDVEDALLERPHRENQHWQPGETPDDLRTEHAVQTALEEAAVAETPNWEGHTHTWPTTLPRSLAEMVTCEECDLTIPASVVAEDRESS